MTADSPDVVIAKRLLDYAKRSGFTFQRAAPGADGPLVGHRLSDDWVDLIHTKDSAATALPGGSGHPH